MLKLLRYISLLCSLFVILSFALFAIAQTSHASQGQANAVSQGTITGTHATSKPIDKEKQPRRFIDQVAQKLNSPWTGIVSSKSIWVQHIIPTLFSLLVYGFGLSFVARWASGRPA